MTEDTRRPAEPDGLPRVRTLAERRPPSRAPDGAGVRVGRPRRGPLPPERVAEIRRNIMAGVYRSPWVLEQVARRLVQSGHLQTAP